MASVACTKERIRDGIAVAQAQAVVGGRRIVWPWVRVSRGKRIYSECCERDYTARFADARQDKVPSRQLTAVARRHHECCHRARILAETVVCLRTMYASDQTKTKDCIVGTTICIPIRMSPKCNSAQKFGREQRQKRKTRTRVVQRLGGGSFFVSDSLATGGTRRNRAQRSYASFLKNVVICPTG